MSDLPSIEDCIEQFNINYPRPKMKPIKLCSNYDLDEDWSKNTPYPTLDKAGVYFLLDGEYKLLYIGESSNMGYRWSAYINWSKDKSTYSVVDHRFPSLKHLYAIEIPEGHEFERLAIEEYMIKKLNPVANTKGKNAS